MAVLVDWLNVHLSITLVGLQLDAQIIDIGWYLLFDPAGFIITDVLILFIQFCSCISISVLLV